VRDDEPRFLEGFEMVSDRTQGEAESPRELPQVKARLRDD
jgi:hypothetical protein